jgi:hypothetical protein
MKAIDKRLGKIQYELDELEIEKESLLIRKQECNKFLKTLLPSSIGGNQKDNLKEWNQNSKILSTFY